MSPAQIAAVVHIPSGGAVVLCNVKAGRSPWHGWDQGTAARTSEGREAYEARARSITMCRDRGLLDANGLLTEQGLACVTAWEARHG